MRFPLAALALSFTLLSAVHAQNAPSTSAVNLAPMDPTIPPLPTQSFELKAQITRPLKLQDAISTALSRSTQLALAQIAVERAEAGVRSAQASLYPTASLTSSYTYNQLANSKISAALTGVTTGVFAAFSQLESAPVSNQINLNWTVYSGGLIPGRIVAAEQVLVSTQLDYDRIRQDVINGVITAYYDLQSADGNLTIGEAAVRSAEATLKDAKSQLSAGTGTRFAVLQADVQKANAEQQRLQYVNDQRVRQQALARLLNLEKPTLVRAEDPVVRSGKWDLGLEESIFRAYQQRHELSQQRALERAAKAQEEAAYGSTSPQVSLFGNVQALDNLLDRVTGIYTGYSGGVQVTWTGFDGGASRAQADQAIADAKSARVRYVDNLNTIRFGVESAFSQLETAGERIDTNQKAVVSAEEGLVLARLRLEAGVGTQTDVLIADRDLTQAKVNRLNAIIDYNRALAGLKRALGVL